MRIFLIVFALAICLSRASFGGSPKEATAHFLSLIFSVAMHTMWPEDHGFEGVAVRGEDDPPAPSPSPSIVARLGDGSNPWWLILPTKSPSASPWPSVSPISQPPVESVGHSDTMDVAEDVFSEVFLDQNVFDVSMLLGLLGDASGAQAAELILAMAESEDAPHNAILDGVKGVLLAGNAAAQAQAIDILLALTQSEHVPSEVRASALLAILESGYPEPSVQAVMPEPLEERGEYCGEVDDPSLAVVYPVINSTEVPINSVFAQWVSVQLSRVSNGLTPEVRAGLLRLARSRSAPWVERVAAVGLLHLKDDGECKAQAAKILTDLAPLVSLHRQAIAEHVRRVLWDHDALAEELIVELENVLEQSSVSISNGGNPIMNNGSERTRESGQDDTRKRNVDCVASEPVSNKEQRIAEGDVCVASEGARILEAETKCFNAGRQRGARDRVRQRSLNEDALRASYPSTKAGQLYPDFFGLYWRAYQRGNDAARMNYDKIKEHPERLGTTNGRKAARDGRNLPLDEHLKARYRKQHDQATEAEVDVYVDSYKTAYAWTTGTLEEQAERLGTSNGKQASRKGLKLPSAEDLRFWYRDGYPDAADVEVEAYVRGYKTAYDKVKRVPAQQTNRPRTMNRMQSLRAVRALPFDEDLKRSYRKKHPDATDMEVQGYVSAYKTMYAQI